MSKLRSLNTSIWSDTWFEGLNPEEKLLFIYLITNDKTNMLGVYETSLRKISFETSIDQKNIEKYVKKFEKDSKLKYDFNRIILLNFLKHQNYNFNMKKSAVRCYNELPRELKTLESSDLPESDKGFETLCNGFGMVRKIEVEYEVELETELEVEEVLDVEAKKASPIKKTKSTIEERKKIFYDKVAEYVNEYSREMLKSFYDYWTEHGDDDHKMRFEKEKSFGTSQRLSTWNKNDLKFKANGTKQPAKKQLTIAEQMERARQNAIARSNMQ